MVKNTELPAVDPAVVEASALSALNPFLEVFKLIDKPESEVPSLRSVVLSLKSEFKFSDY